MSEQNWLGNVWDAAVVRDPLFNPNFAWWMHNYDDCDCPECAQHPPDCLVTPIYAAVYADVGLPTPWDWPLRGIYVEIAPHILGFGPEALAKDLRSTRVMYPNFVIEQGNWEIRQENPEK